MQVNHDHKGDDHNHNNNNSNNNGKEQSAYDWMSLL